MVWRLLLVVLVNPRWVPIFKTNNKMDRPKKRALVIAPVRWGCRLAKKRSSRQRGQLIVRSASNYLRVGLRVRAKQRPATEKRVANKKVAL